MHEHTYTQWKYPYGFSDFPIPKDFREDPKL